MDIYNLEAENSLMGTVLTYGLDAFDEIQGNVSIQDLFKEQNRIIWELFENCSENREPIDPVLVLEKSKNKMINMAYLAELMNGYPDPAKIKEYAKIVRKQGMARRKIAFNQDQINRLKNGDDPEEVISQGMPFDSELLENNSIESVRFIGDKILQYVDDIEERKKAGRSIIGLRTGFDDLDRVLGGLDPDTVTVLAGQPGAGKTTFAENIAKNIAKKYGPVYFGSLEMSFDQLRGKFLSQESGVNSMAFRNVSMLQDDDIGLLTRAAANINDVPILIDDSLEMKVSQLAIRIRRYKKKYGIKFVVIDYFQLIEPDKYSSDQRAGYDANLKMIKKLTREIKLPILLLSQMNRNINQRKSEEPVLSDLKETGKLEQDAAAVIFLYQSEKDPKGIITAKIAKNRFGPADFKIKFIFEKEKSLFKPDGISKTRTD